MPFAVSVSHHLRYAKSLVKYYLLFLEKRGAGRHDMYMSNSFRESSAVWLEQPKARCKPGKRQNGDDAGAEQDRPCLLFVERHGATAGGAPELVQRGVWLRGVHAELEVVEGAEMAGAGNRGGIVGRIVDLDGMLKLLGGAFRACLTISV